ncbi:MAG: hypothetical protein WCS43_11045 [Verrucomicrobiota bacterium]
MKTLLFLILSIVPLTSRLPAEQKGNRPKNTVNRDYPIKDIPTDDPRFVQILGLINANIILSQPRRVGIKFLVVQTAGEGRFLVKTSEYGDICSLEYPGVTIVDNTRIEISAVESGTYSYTSVLGARKTVKNYKFSPPPPTPTLSAEQLIANLKDGKDYTVDVTSGDTKQIVRIIWEKP